MKTLLSLFLFLAPSLAQASGGVVCTGTYAPDKFKIWWGATHGIGSPLFGHISIEYRDQKYVLGLEARKTEVGTIAMPMQVVGYWVDGAKSVKIKVTDEQLLRTLVHIEATEGKDGAILGDAYMQLTAKMPSRKMGVKCVVE